MATLIPLLFSGAVFAADSNYSVPAPGEVFSYKDITPEIWDATDRNKKLDPMNELVEAMRVNREIALNDPKAPQQFSGEDLLQPEFSSASQPWQPLEKVFSLDWSAIETESSAELAQLRKALKVKTVLNHPDIKIIELALGAGALLPRHADVAPGAFHIIEGSAEITVDGQTIHVHTGTSVKLESLSQRRIKVTSDTPLKLLWFRWAPGGQQVYLDYGYYLTGSNFHAQPLESVMPVNYEHWEESSRRALTEIKTADVSNSPSEEFIAQQQQQLIAMKKQEQFKNLSGLYPSTPQFSNELDVNWLDFENIPAEGFFWAKDASKAGYALKAWNKMVRMKGIFQAKVPGSQYDFNISYIGVGPKGKYITHSHATPEFYYILGGETEWIVDGKTYIAKAGNMYVHSPYVDHEMRGLVEGEPEVVITGSWSPYGDRSVFQAQGLLTESLVEQAESSFIANDFNFHDFKIKKGLAFQKK
ncbi:MAG: cupin domain-containing protein [Proteobacteria bacterium]|nr:cupin domain-containing protein [Pseudomonadota bacterium]